MCVPIGWAIKYKSNVRSSKKPQSAEGIKSVELASNVLLNSYLKIVNLHIYKVGGLREENFRGA